MDKQTYNNPELAKQQRKQALSIFVAALGNVSADEIRQQSKLQILRSRLANLLRYLN